MSEYTPTIDPSHAGGAALVVGFLVVIGALYARDPTAAVDTATANPAAAAYFLVLPAVGLAAGVYAYAGGPYSGIPLFCLGSYRNHEAKIHGFSRGMKPTTGGQTTLQ